MAGNYVEILVKSKDDAKPDLDDLRARLADLGRQTETARAEVDDAGGAAKLDDLRAKLLRLSAQVANPKISLSGAVRAEAQLHAVEASLSHLGDDTARETGRSSRGLGDMDRKLKDTGSDSETARGRLSALGGAVNGLTLGLSGGFGEMTMFGKAMAGLSLATGLGEPLVAGLTVAVGGLSSGIVAAGAGLGIFGAVTKSVFSGISTNIAKATAAENKMATAGSLKQQDKDAQAFEKTLKGLSPAQRQLTVGAANAESGWHSFVTSATAGVAGVLVPALNLVPRALSLMKPFLAPVESALRGIVTQVSTGLNSSGFKSFMGEMAKSSGPMLTGLGTAIMNIVKGLGGILKTFLPVAHEMTGGLDNITAKFAKWGQTLGSHSGFQSLMSMFKSETPMAMGALKSLAGIIKTVVSQMTGMSTFSNSKMLLQLAGPILKFANALLKAHPGLVNLILYLKLASDGGKKLHTAFSAMSGIWQGIQGGTSALGKLRGGFSDAEVAASGASGVMGTLGGKLSSMTAAIGKWGIGSKIAAAATRVWTGIQAAFDVVMDANPIVLVVIAIAALVAAIIIISIKVKAFRDFWKDAWKDITKWADDAWHGIEKAFKAIEKAVSAAIGDVLNWVKGHWPLLVGIFLGPIALIAAELIQHWHAIYDGAKTVLGDVIGFFRRLPGEIMGAISGLGSRLFSAGAHIISMLAAGLRSAIGDVTGAIGNIAGEITSHLPFSPAKKGPLSGAGDPQRSGRKIGQMLAQGIASSRGTVEEAAARMAGGAVTRGGGGGYGAGSAAGRLEVTLAFEKTGNAMIDEAFRALRIKVREVGGGGPNSVQRALGRTT